MKFTIPRGEAFYCEFQVKQPGASLPLDLTNSTGTFTLATIGATPCLVLDAIAMTVEDAINGEISITLTEDQTADLISKVGFAEDGYPTMATYKASIYITGEEEIFVDIPKVFISDSGETCA